jgi:spore maturation protein CgeB
MRILIIYPGHAVSTREVSQGYETALRELGHEVSAYNYHDRLAFYDSALDFFEQTNPQFERQPGDVMVLSSEPVAIQAIDFVPDVVLVVCGLSLHKRAYDLLHSLGLPIFLLLTESPYADEVQAELIRHGHITGVLTNDRNSLGPLHELTAVPICYLPHSYDPTRHYPHKVGPEYHSDLYFFGTIWPERKELIQVLEAIQNGHAFNLGGIPPNNEEWTSGLQPNKELIKGYSGTRIALNHHRTVMDNDGDEVSHIPPGAAWSLGPRAYEIAACGAFQICDDSRPELGQVFGDSVPTYRDADSLRELVIYYLDHDDEREQKAADAFIRVQQCSFENRAQHILIPFMEEIKYG